ncbi:MAG: hypothetical protein UY53_C0004G0077 [Parcubacteria group bacterium GW2011_GWA2_50_10]|uniref:HNH endonuclease n=1 Tax=Candidatus Yanofskybacteria bacterium GW2011_GWC1_48_11 TaxID=1619027 RepID=A0A837IMA5_9BACT|nr:MAG: hypothetical protein UY25_C0001G0136 [Candidatus Yanofskybacteria bacterium GW2011_GWC1_48_11]KKW03889.1 MAG: hypothetical protein UY38_C0002G0043 [Parcubacteria group bacterium GW2011_GWB1_49_12]KKW08549.1 MAG: hypothetical protein UY45_C0006G0035 [Parcubacteria group bacterium GW2011_GWA1_49_26]KKW14026.1 MAG: hypothetical protein UY53_C0004G0077 [Parcubacteria group bacterium GW2011_GWA2_50_10]
MPRVECKICGKDFYAKPNWLRRGWGKYCSRECKHKGQKNGRFAKCFICQKEVYKTRKELRVSQSKKYFCSKRCQTIWRNSIVYVGENHWNWKGGEHIEYRDRLRGSGIKEWCRVCGTSDKRILCAHHLDRNRRNNALENLIWLCHNCHYLVHHYGTAIPQRDKNMVDVA